MKKLRCWYKSITKNKTLEIQVTRWEDWQWFEFECKWTRRQDHAGFQLNVQVLGFYFHIWFCDNRHWDWDEDGTEHWETEEVTNKRVSYKGADQGTLGPED